MILTAPEHEAVHYIARNLRQVDRDEIFALRFHDSPFVLTNEAMAYAEMSWVFWHDGFPAAMLGGAHTTPGVWTMFCFGTDAFDKVARSLTKFISRRLIPTLFDELKAHRLQADALATNTTSRRWLERFGAVQEGVLKGRGRKGEDFVTYALTKPLDQTTGTA